MPYFMFMLMDVIDRYCLSGGAVLEAAMQKLT